MKYKDRLQALENQLARLLNRHTLPKESYLAGGTAVYFYLKHRVSVDLDFFTPTNFNSEAFVHQVKQNFDDVDIELMEQNTIILYIGKEKIKFSLFFFPYPLLSKPVSYEISSNAKCPMASFEDIEAMKAVAISQRGSAKDFIDLFFLLNRTGHSFNDVLNMVIKKYDVKTGYDYHLKTSFTYFDDAEKEIDSILMLNEAEGIAKIKKDQWEKIMGYFRSIIK